MLGSCKWSLTLFLHDIPSWANPCHLHQTKKVRYQGQHLHIHIRLKHCCLHSYLTENCLKAQGLSKVVELMLFQMTRRGPEAFFHLHLSIVCSNNKKSIVQLIIFWGRNKHTRPDLSISSTLSPESFSEDPSKACNRDSAPSLSVGDWVVLFSASSKLSCCDMDSCTPNFFVDCCEPSEIFIVQTT